MRLFIAAEISDDVKKRLVEMQGELKEMDLPVKWVKPAGIHLTLKFLGETDENRIEEIDGIVGPAVAPFGRFDLVSRGLGAFPNPRRPRVVWVGLDWKETELEEIQTGIEKGLASIGFKKEKRRFSPHLTLGRIRDKADFGELERRIEKGSDFSAGTMPIDRIVLYRSILKPSGAEYIKLSKYPLKGDQSSADRNE